MSGYRRVVHNLAFAFVWIAATAGVAGIIGHQTASSIAQETLLSLDRVAALAAAEAAREQVEEAPNGVYRLHGILRPDAEGNWYVQIDDTHEHRGIDGFVQQTNDHLRIFTFGRNYSRAGTIQISSDDGFGGVITGHANLGLNTARIEVRARGERIDPAEIWSHLPPDRLESLNGNFWINMTMIE